MSMHDDIVRVRGLIRSRSDKLLQALFLEAHRRVVLKTPVDTGRARGNWQPTIGEPAGGTNEDALDKSGGATIAEGAGVAKQLKFGDTAYTVNNLPYINRLENGWSQQAPQGMVAVTVEELKNVSDAIVSEIESGKR
jgi:hypothetical protein